MNVIIKLGLLLLCFGMCSAAAAPAAEEELKCNLRYCGAELLNFEKFSIGQLFRKMELASFCVKNCTPPVVHEFFQSIIYSVTKRIPGHCSGEDCIDQNRFVALAKCVEDEAWPLLQCGKTLIDLAHISLVQNPAEEKRNHTCRIVTETVQCIEESLQRCGDKPFQLVKEILGDLINAGIATYCHPAYRKEGWLIKPTTIKNLHPDAVTIPPSPGPTYKHPQFVKGYKPDSAPGLSHVSYICLLLSVTLSIILSGHHIH